MSQFNFCFPFLCLQDLPCIYLILPIINALISRCSPNLLKIIQDLLLFKAVVFPVCLCNASVKSKVKYYMHFYCHRTIITLCKRLVTRKSWKQSKLLIIRIYMEALCNIWLNKAICVKPKAGCWCRLELNDSWAVFKPAPTAPRRLPTDLLHFNVWIFV